MKPTFEKKLSEVLNHQTVTKTFQSAKTGNEYQADVIEKLVVVSIGTLEEKSDGSFKYAVVDSKNNLEYSITAPNKVEISFGAKLLFVNVRGGALNNGAAWFKAERVGIMKAATGN